MRTARQLAGDQKRKLKTMQAKLLGMAEEWDGVDQFLLGELRELSDSIEKIVEAMDEVNPEAGC